MKFKVSQLYLWQLVIASSLSVLVLLFVSFAKNYSNYDTGTLIILSLVGSLFFAGLNAVINVLNFTYNTTKNLILPFYLPALIWLIIFGFNLYEINSEETSEFLMLIIWIEPFIYNLVAPKILST